MAVVTLENNYTVHTDPLPSVWVTGESTLSWERNAEAQNLADDNGSTNDESVIIPESRTEWIILNKTINIS
jgi:hypothetical protein